MAITVRPPLTVPPALRAEAEDEALAMVTDYLAQKVDGPVHTGAVFETIGAGWDSPGSQFTITPTDLIAVSMLRADVPARAAIDVLDRHAAKISTLLARIDPDVHLVDAGDDVLIERGSPGNQLWFLLCSRRGRTGMGPTTASKLLARKRPNLFPVHDPAAGAEVGWMTTRTFWRELRSELAADDRALWHRLCRLQERVSPDRAIAPLRIFDIVTWMDARSGPAPVVAVPAPRERPAD